MSPAKLSIGQCATLACLLEVTAPKPGNVHRGADFEDLTFSDFAASAVAIAPAMDGALESGVGTAVLTAAQATRSLVNTNTNLGTVLLLAPLSAVPPGTKLDTGVAQIIKGLTASDTRQVYEAIRIANPGGMGEVDSMDLAETPPDNLLAAMRHAASRDLVARQYATDFSEVFGVAATGIVRGVDKGWRLMDAIVHTHVKLMSQFPDSLIARKYGDETVYRSAELASHVLEAGEPGDEDYHCSLSDLDFWLRSDHHRRNPGTTADLIAAGLFVLLRDEIIQPPYR